MNEIETAENIPRKDSINFTIFGWFIVESTCTSLENPSNSSCDNADIRIFYKMAHDG